MLNKVQGVVFWSLLICAACLGQSSFQGLTPGASTRNDVTRVLGQPTRPLSATLFEFAPPAGIGRGEVEYTYGGQAPVVRRIEVYLLKPVSRSALIQKFSLPQQGDAKRTNAAGRLVEYFGGPTLLVFTYATGEEGSGVTSIGYYSRELFNSTVASAPANQGPTRPVI
jgi:hypothetical protein